MMHMMQMDPMGVVHMIMMCLHQMGILPPMHMNM
jgi:hypothetical protein